MTDDENRLGIGGNNPPSDEVLLQERLENETLKLRERYDALLEAAARVPDTCTDDETAGKFADMIKLIAANARAFEDKRKIEKEPYMTLQRSVDGYFKKFAENLDNARKLLDSRLNKYMLKKAEDRRRELAAEAEKQRLESERLANEAAALSQANMTNAAEETMQEAQQAEDDAIKAEQKAESRPADLARTRGNYGGLATLRTTWTGEIVDRDQLDIGLLKAFIPLDALQKALNGFVKAGGRECKGTRIFEKSTTQVR